MTPRALVATSTGNTGIDQRDLDMVGRSETSRDIIIALQDLGRNCRWEGMVGQYLVYFFWEQVVAMVLTILLSKETKHESRSTYTNSAISRGSDIPQAPVPEQAASLSKRQKRINRDNTYSDFLDYLRLYCLPGLGCIHSRTKWFSATGSLDHVPDEMLPYVKDCFVCTNRCAKYFLPIVHDGVRSFLRSRKFVDAMSISLMYIVRAKCFDQLVGRRQGLACSRVWENHG